MIVAHERTGAVWGMSKATERTVAAQSAQLSEVARADVVRAITARLALPPTAGRQRATV